MAPSTLAKTYQRTGKEWTRPEVCDILEHATSMAKKHGAGFAVGEDDGGRITVCPEESLPRDVWRICSTAVPKPTGRRDAELEIEAYSDHGMSYTNEHLQVDDVASRILDCLAYGIVNNGPLLDMTLGLEQMEVTLESARLIQERRGGRLICGIRRSRTNKYPEHVVAVSQMSQRSEFVEPLAAVISDDGVSMLSRPQNMARLKLDSLNDDPGKAWRSIRARIANRIYHGGWAFSVILYGVLEAGKIGARVLQDEIADMAMVCRARVRYKGDIIRVSANEYGHLECMYPRYPEDKGAAADTSIEIDSKSLWDGDKISKDAVAKSAQDAVRKFSKLRPFRPCPDKPSRSTCGASFPGPEENYPRPAGPRPEGPATLPVVRHGF